MLPGKRRTCVELWATHIPVEASRPGVRSGCITASLVLSRSLLLCACDHCDDDAPLRGCTGEKKTETQFDIQIVYSHMSQSYKVNKATKRPTTLIFSALF